MRFYYQPKFLQGSAALQLCCKLPPTEVDSILELYLSTVRQVENGTGDVIKAEDEQNPLRGALFRDERNKDFAPLPEDFLILILDATPPENWNHGCSRRVAVSTKRQEVIYWAECW